MKISGEDAGAAVQAAPEQEEEMVLEIIGYIGSAFNVIKIGQLPEL